MSIRLNIQENRNMHPDNFSSTDEMESFIKRILEEERKKAEKKIREAVEKAKAEERRKAKAEILRLEKEKREAENREAEVVRENKQLKKEKKRKAKKLEKPIDNWDLPKCIKKLMRWKYRRVAQYKTAEILYRNWITFMDKKYYQILKAVPKSGKRIIAEIIACMLYNDCFNPDKDCCIFKNLKPSNYLKPIHMTGFNRKSCEQQLDEMRKCGFYSEAVANKQQSIQLFEDYIEKENITEENYKYALLFIDEADYASGVNMKLEPWISKWLGNSIFISATPEEVIAGFDLNKKGEYKVVHFSPPSKFKGKKWFYKKGLIHEPKPFTVITNPKPQNFNDLSDEEKELYKDEEIDISKHGKEIIYKCQQEMEEYKDVTNRKNDRNHCDRKVIFVRKVKNSSGSYSDMKEKLKETVEEKKTRGIIYDNYTDDNGNVNDIKYKLYFVDGNENEFGKLSERKVWKNACERWNCPIVVFVCNKASRSTELAQPLENDETGEIKENGAHHYLYAFHDERKLRYTSNYNTVAQAIGRVNHYDILGHPIHLYVCELTCKIEAEIGDWKERKAKLPNLSTRCVIKRDKDSSDSPSSSSEEDVTHLPKTSSSYYYKQGESRMKTKKKKKNTLLVKFNNWEGAYKFVKEKCGSKIHERKKNEDGFYHGNIRGDAKVWSVEGVYKETNGGLSRGKYRVTPCYSDIDDPRTLWWVVAYNPDMFKNKSQSDDESKNDDAVDNESKEDDDDAVEGLLSLM